MEKHSMAKKNVVALFAVGLMLMTAVNPDTLPHPSDIGEEVGFMFPLRNGRFFIGLIIDTFWCGSGNVSRGLYELGPNYLVDDCCRSHDLCTVFIEPGEVKYGVQNNGSYTMVSCDCDTIFFKCLESLNTYSSLAVLNAYSLTYPLCLQREFVCQSPDNNYNNNPCKGYRDTTETNLCSTSENRCKIYDLRFTKIDSQFKLFQQKQEATTRANEKERGTASFPSRLLPSVWQIFRNE